MTCLRIHTTLPGILLATLATTATDKPINVFIFD